MNRKPTIYVAGPMRGFENYNYPAFDRQTRVLRAQGWDVVNPADMDRTQFQPDSDPNDFNPDINYEDQEFMRDALKRDMVAICDKCTSKISLDIQSRKTTIHGTKGQGMVRARQKTC